MEGPASDLTTRGLEPLATEDSGAQGGFVHDFTVSLVGADAVSG